MRYFNIKGVVIIFILSIFLQLFLTNVLFADTSYEVELDNSKYGSECYGGKSNYYVDIPYSYSGSKVSLKAQGTTNPSSCADLSIDLCDWDSSCYVNVSAGQRLNFQVSWYCGYCGDYESQSWTIEANSVSGPVCGNGSCERGEDCSSCSSDCGCAFGTECCSPSSSYADSKGCVSHRENISSNYICCYGAEYYGDCCSGYDCNIGEVCSGHTCAKSSYCGDGTCDSGETCSSCSSDCGSCGPVCGNGLCESGENCYDCAGDCACAGGCCIHPDSVMISGSQDWKGCVSNRDTGAYKSGEYTSYYVCCDGKQKTVGEKYVQDGGLDCCSDSDCSAGESCLYNYCKEDAEEIKKSNGEYCDKDSECKSDNCRNYRCCAAGKECCFSHNHCGLDEYCSSFYHFCEPAKPLGQKCTEDDECLSDTCGDKAAICCEYGQVCCNDHSDCRDNEYCEQDSYSCRYKWQIGEKCGDYGSAMCVSGHCDHATWTCAEKQEGVDEEVSVPEEKAVCGNKNYCEYWLNEDCENCPADCGFQNACCAPGKYFMYPSDYNNTIYSVHEALGGIAPSGTFVVPKGLLETTFFSEYMPQMCKNGEIVEGTCINSWDCPEGICDKNFQCVKTISQEFKKVEDEEIAQKIYEKQTYHQTEFSEAYNEIKDDISFCTGHKGLKICLEIQGKTVKKENLEAIKGEAFLATLNIENISSHNIAVVPEISFSSDGEFEVEEYNMGFNWSGGLHSILGNFLTNLTKTMGGKYVVMSPQSEFIVYSKIIPKETEKLNIKGLVYSTTDEEFIDKEPGLIDIILKPEQYEKNFEKSEVSEFITIKEKPCKWMFCI